MVVSDSFLSGDTTINNFVIWLACPDFSLGCQGLFCLESQPSQLIQEDEQNAQWSYET